MNIKNICTALYLLSVLFIISCKQKQVVPDCGTPPGADKLFVFVGEKIEVNDITDEDDGMDLKFSAKYKILQKICGVYASDTISFTGYDHYGMPEFSKSKTSLLFLLAYNDTFYHAKYLHFDVHKTTDNRWAGYPYKTLLRIEDSIHFKPQKLDFVLPISYSVEGRTRRDVKRFYPPQFFTRKGDSVTTTWGNYVEDLYSAMKKTALKRRGYFDTLQRNTLIVNEEVKIAERQEELAFSKTDLSSFKQNWQNF